MLVLPAFLLFGPLGAAERSHIVIGKAGAQVKITIHRRRRNSFVAISRFGVPIFVVFHEGIETLFPFVEDIRVVNSLFVHELFLHGGLDVLDWETYHCFVVGKIYNLVCGTRSIEFSRFGVAKYHIILGSLLFVAARYLSI